MPLGEHRWLGEEARRHIDAVVRGLAAHFAGTYSPETVEGVVDDTLERWRDAPITAFVPVLVHRFARERLTARAQAEGALTKEAPEVLLVCTHNAGRSQLAAALLEHRSGGRVGVRSAGTAPADELNPHVVTVLAELGIDAGEAYPKPLTDEVVRAADVVVTMGCGDACPVHPGIRYRDWELADPAGRGLDEVSRIRDDIDLLVCDLLDELAVPAAKEHH